MKIPLFKYEDIEINYFKQGVGEPLVLISGYGNKLTGWNFQFPFFKDKMMTISLDNRGVGKTSRPNYSYTMDMFCDDIKNLLDSLNIQKKIHLCGHSMGGMICQNFALKYPDIVKTLILCATSAFVDPTPLVGTIERMFEQDEEQIMKTAFTMLFSRTFRKIVHENKDIYNRIKNEMMEDPIEAQNIINQASAMYGHDTRNLLDKIKHPTLIMAGTKDLLLPLMHSKFIHEKLPNSRLEIFSGLGHGFIIEIADKVNELIWNFIQEHI